MKKNIRDDFEAVYLRSNIVRRDIGNADPTALASPDFNKICSYMAGRCFLRNKTALLSRGFDYQDVLSVTKVFGATYVGANYTHKDASNRTNRNLMMRYVGHRLNTMVRWVSKKMKDEELLDRRYEITSGEMDHVPDEADIQNSSTLDEINFLEEDFSEEKSMKKRKLMSMKLREKRKDYAKKRKDERNLTTALKIKLETNHDKMTDILAYYSTTKSVSFDMRKVARRYCARYGIDYKAVAENIIKRNNYDKLEFDL